MRWANNNLPIFNGSRDLVCATHFRKTDATNDKHNNAWHIFDCCLRFVLVPVTIPSAEMETEIQMHQSEKFCVRFNCGGNIVPGRRMVSTAALSASSQKWEMPGVQLLFDTIFDDVLHDGSPTGHLISVLGDSFFSWNCILFLAISLRIAKENMSSGDMVFFLSTQWRLRYLRRLYNWRPRNSNFWPCPVLWVRFEREWIIWLNFLLKYRFWSSRRVRWCELCRNWRCPANGIGVFTQCCVTLNAFQSDGLLSPCPAEWVRCFACDLWFFHPRRQCPWPNLVPHGTIYRRIPRRGSGKIVSRIKFKSMAVRSKWTSGLTW